MKRSKKYKEAEKQIEKGKLYALKDACSLVKKVAISKFPSTIQIHINLKLTEKQKKESIRGSVVLPYSTGAGTKKIAVITTPGNFKSAEGADFVGNEDLIKKIQDGWTEFDILIATPDVMPKIAILGKVLGPKGKMPNPKNETVTTDLKKTIESFKKGKVNFKADKQFGIHQTIGKTSMKEEEIFENAKEFMRALNSELAKLGSNPIKNVFLAPTMGPAIKIDLASLS